MKDNASNQEEPSERAPVTRARMSGDFDSCGHAERRVRMTDWLLGDLTLLTLG